ncbi:MAG: thiolase family protein [Kofleriaceae bacterium]|jgi:acetyl-CoA acyltransferase|nr:thiolase family protein [Kofleriaceae bacterium]MBP9172363.1 thiolase family protein [Kofleriaceae bacterium]MBP9862739.1 thiolase family protein [Kofleriaceae bacterium]
MNDIIIAEAVRSAVGRGHKGSLSLRRPDELAADVLRGLIARVPQAKGHIDDVVMGCAMPEGEQGLNVARLIALSADLGIEVPAQTINRFCSSGLQAIATAAGAIAIGSCDAVIAGGVESMTYVPMTGFHISASPELMASLPAANTPMGITAENVAKKFGISREDQDKFAYGSQQKAKVALDKGVFNDEIVPVRAVSFDAKGDKVYRDFTVDELPRAETTLEGLAKLPPAFAQGGSVTAGNASPISDGAAAALVMSAAKAKELGVKPLGYFRSFVTVGVDPAIMGIGPLPAVQKLLAKNNLTVADIDLFEMNEAFACQAIYCQRELGIPDEKLNVNGGAIALGHPLGCTGAKLTATALYELRRRGGRYAIVTMCIGGGQGAAGLFERA